MYEKRGLYCLQNLDRRVLYMQQRFHKRMKLVIKTYKR